MATSDPDPAIDPLDDADYDDGGIDPETQSILDEMRGLSDDSLTACEHIVGRLLTDDMLEFATHMSRLTERTRRALLHVFVRRARELIMAANAAAEHARKHQD